MKIVQLEKKIVLITNQIKKMKKITAFEFLKEAEKEYFAKVQKYFSANGVTSPIRIWRENNVLIISVIIKSGKHNEVDTFTKLVSNDAIIGTNTSWGEDVVITVKYLAKI